jgi:predicted site-specific integrase-resolvase
MEKEPFYSVGQFAKLTGKSVRTVQRWDKDGILVALRTQTNRRYYTQSHYNTAMGITANNTGQKGKVVCYTRVSGNDQKNDLASQKLALEQYVIAKGIAVDDWVSDIGSGLNYKRKNFNNLLIEVEGKKISKIIIAHKDRFVRFGYEWFIDFCNRHGCEIEIINVESLSPEQEVVKDLLTIIHCFSSRLYGLRRYKKEIKAMISGENENHETI